MDTFLKLLSPFPIAVDFYSLRTNGPHGDNPFEKDNTKDDGRVSRDEFNGPADMFDKIDVNSDGYIEKDELPKGPGGPGDSEEGHGRPKHE